MISNSTVISICLISLFVLVSFYESRQEQDTPQRAASQTNQKVSKQASEQGSKKTGKQASNLSPVDYQTIRPLFWSRLYANGGQSLYCGKRFGGGSHRGLNVEHVFPMSWATKAL